MFLGEELKMIRKAPLDQGIKSFEEKREELVGDKKKVDVKLQKKMVRDKNKEYYG